MASYDIPTYLLDRANVQDTIAKLAYYYDTPTEAKIGMDKHVFAPDVKLDYRSVSNSDKIISLPGPVWAARAAKAYACLTASHHEYTCSFTDLPQPTATPTGSSVQRPDTCIVKGQGSATMVKKGARGGDLIQNGGKFEIQLVRIPALEEQGYNNPWRIAKVKYVLAYEKGNRSVMDVMDFGFDVIVRGGGGEKK